MNRWPSSHAREGLYSIIILCNFGQNRMTRTLVTFTKVIWTPGWQWLLGKPKNITSNKIANI